MTTSSPLFIVVQQESSHDQHQIMSLPFSQEVVPPSIFHTQLVKKTPKMDDRSSRRTKHHRRGVLLVVAVFVILVLCFFPSHVSGQDIGSASASTSQQKTNEGSEDKRVWGASSRDSHQQQQQQKEESNQTQDDQPQHQQQQHVHHSSASNGEDSTASGSSSSSSGSKIPFVPKPKTQPYQDPFSKGFEIKARVYTDPSDKLAHFDFDTPIIFPYWECGVQGSSTAPIPLQHFSVRHMLGGSKPNSFTTGVGNSGEDFRRYGNNKGRDMDGSSDDFGPNPELLIPLGTVDVVLNSGETHTFEPGSVVLLENVLMGGHKLVGHDHHDMIALLLTLPHPYRHVGKEKNSLTTMFAKTFWKQSPCKTGLSVSGDGTAAFDSDEDSQRRNNGLAEWVMSAPHRGMRRVGLGIIGAGMSLALADFIGKTAPFILAVMFGGGSLVLGGTMGIVKMGEYSLDQLELWNEKRMLKIAGGDIVQEGSASDDDDDFQMPEVPIPDGGRKSEGFANEKVEEER